MGKKLDKLLKPKHKEERELIRKTHMNGVDEGYRFIKEVLQPIQDKLAKGEPLTDEEQAIVEQRQAFFFPGGE